jgi:hypothetical protein
LTETAKSMRRGLIVVANPESGPGYDPDTGTYRDPDPNYVDAMGSIRAHCSLVLGYVHDCYANTSTDASTCPRVTNIFDDVDRWLQAYTIDGLFVDQTSATDLDRAEELVSEILQRRPGAVVVLNPGSTPSREFMSRTEPAIVVIQEDEFSDYSTWPGEQWVSDRENATNPTPPADRLAIIGHTPSPTGGLDALCEAASRYQIRWIHAQHTVGSVYNEFSTFIPTVAERLDPCAHRILFFRAICRSKSWLSCRFSKVIVGLHR